MHNTHIISHLVTYDISLNESLKELYGGKGQNAKGPGRQSKIRLEKNRVERACVPSIKDGRIVSNNNNYCAKDNDDKKGVGSGHKQIKKKDHISIPIIPGD